MSGWIKIGLEFIKTLTGHRKGQSCASSTTQTETDNTIGADSAFCADSITVGSEDPIGIGIHVSFDSQEIDRRREIVRGFFNDFWKWTEDKPATFAERLDQAEGYINERLVACGEAWQLDPGTRQQLRLISPPARKS
jgi:hypothetical protein